VLGWYTSTAPTCVSQRYALPNTPCSTFVYANSTCTGLLSWSTLQPSWMAALVAFLLQKTSASCATFLIPPLPIAIKSSCRTKSRTATSRNTPAAQAGSSQTPMPTRASRSLSRRRFCPLLVSFARSFHPTHLPTRHGAVLSTRHAALLRSRRMTWKTWESMLVPSP
jgi:hypothetical protein